MGINVSHGSNQNQEERRSATTIANLGKQLAHALPASDWRQISRLFDGNFGGELAVPAAEAGKIAVILRSAAWSRKMESDWADEAALFADAADRAARAGEYWMWH